MKIIKDKHDNGLIELFSRNTASYPQLKPETPRSYAGGPSHAPKIVAFNRLELNKILNVYARRVGDGDWRDYAISHSENIASFAIFRRSSEVPLYQVIKNPKLANKQGAYSVVNASGLVLRRGKDLSQVLKVIDRRPKIIAS